MSLSFSAASNQFLEANASPGGISDYPLTVSMAVKLSSGISQCLFWLGNSAAANAWITALAVDQAANTFYAQSRNIATTAVASSTTDPDNVVGQWIHLAAVFSASNSRAIYLNGSEQGSNTVDQAAPTLNRVSIGHFGDATPAQPMDGLVAYCAVWEAALTAQEIATFHGGASPADVQPNALAEVWDFSSSAAPLTGLVNGLVLTQTGNPALSSDNPDLDWLAGGGGGGNRSLRLLTFLAKRRKNTRQRRAEEMNRRAGRITGV